MKFSMNTDFTKFPRAISAISGEDAGEAVPFDIAVLAHDERHLRRRVVELVHGDKVLVDLLEPVVLNDRDRLVLEDGRHVEIIAADEDVYDIRARDGVHLAELAWHIGNRHLAASIEADRILILRDHVIKAMLEGLGATVTEVSEPFQPVRGAYSGGHDHGHGGHAQPDAYGRMPGDPHYGHNHGPGEHHHHHDDHHAEAHSHSHAEAHAHSHSHSHDHHHEHHAHGGERDKFGRLPGDPHYGHNHA